jgi:hypothetical protein
VFKLGTCFKILRWSAIAAAMMMGLADRAHAQMLNVTATWNANPEPDIQDYRLSYHLEGQSTWTDIQLGNVTSHSFSLPCGFSYYFVVRARNTSQLISNPSTPEVFLNLLNDAALAPISNQTTPEGSSVSLQLPGSGCGVSPMVYSATGLPSGLTVNSSTGLITGTPSYVSAGTYSVTATVTKGIETESRTFTWTVTNVNRAPTLSTIANQTHAENTAVSLQLAGSDPDGQALSYSVSGLPPSLSVNPATGLISGTLSYTSAGTHSVTATVSDGSLSASQTFTWTVTNVNRPPTLDLVADQTHAENTAVSLQLAGNDPDGQTLTYTATGLPPSLTVSAATGLISGTLSNTSAGSHSVTATVSDGSLSASRTFTWTVTDSNQAPVLANPGEQPGSSGETYAQAVLADTPTGYWRFGETSGTSAADRAGSNTGTLVGGVLSNQAGVFHDNPAKGFTGVDGVKVTVPNGPAVAALDGASALALEGWINPQAQAVASHYQIFYSFPGQPASYLAAYDNGGALRVVVALVINGVQRSFVAGPALTAGSWYHVIATYDGAALTLYVDGIAVGQLTGLGGPVSIGTGGIELGGYAMPGGYGFNGLLDEPAIYSHSLSPARVAAHYAQRSYAHAVLADLPVSYWRLAETSGTAAADRAGSNNATVAGGVTMGQQGALDDGTPAMSFDGIDGSSVTAPNSASLAAINASTAMTMEAWVNPQSLALPSGFRLFYSFPGQPASYLGVYDAGGTPKFVVSLVINGVQRSFAAGPPVTTGSWYHVVATYDGAALTLSVNGSPVGQLPGLSGLVDIGAAGIKIGGYPMAGANLSFDGVVDEAAIYSHALSQAEVATHYALRTLAPTRDIALQLVASDPDGDTITYSASGLPAGLSINPTTGLISGTLTAAPGSYLVTVTASDGTTSTSQTFTWVIPNNRAPVLANPGDQPGISSEDYTQGVLSDTPVAYWRFGDTSGVNAADRVGTNPGLVALSVSLDEPGVFRDNGAMAFTGADGSKVTVPNSPALMAIDGGAGIALEAWINPQAATVPSQYQIFYSFPGLAASYVGLYDSGGVLRPLVAMVINGVQRSFVAGPALTVGAWYHVAVTYDGAALTLYLNGTAVGQLTGLSGPVGIGTGGIQLGGYPIAGGYGFNGLVDEPAIYSHTLSAARVAAHYAQRTYAHAVLSDTAVAFWRLDEATGTTAADRAGTNDGAVSGGVTLGEPGALSDGNTAMRFDGADGSSVTAPNSATLMAINGSEAITMEAWINPESLVLPSGFRLFYSFPGQPASYLGLFNGGPPRIVVALVIDGVQRSFAAGPTLVAGSWYHVAATYDGAALTLYVNGSPVGELTGLSGPVNIGASGVQIGGYPMAGANLSFDGVVDDAAIYGRALSAAEIATHYAMRTLTVNTAVRLQLNATDPDDDAVTYSASGLPIDLSIDPDTGLISGTLTSASVGTHAVTVTASDGTLSTNQSFTWVVTNP